MLSEFVKEKISERLRVIAGEPEATLVDLLAHHQWPLVTTKSIVPYWLDWEHFPVVPSPPCCVTSLLTNLQRHITPTI